MSAHDETRRAPMALKTLSEVLIYAQHQYLAHRRQAHASCEDCGLTEERYARAWRERAEAINAWLGGNVLPVELPP